MFSQSFSKIDGITNIETAVLFALQYVYVIKHSWRNVIISFGN